MIWILPGIVLLAIAGYLFWRIRKSRRHRMIALVALLREPTSIDPAVLARVAGKCWDADLGDGSEDGAEGEDGFVAGVGPMNTIMHDGQMYLINCIPKPYVDDPETAAEAIPDRRIRSLFTQHQAWFSCDALGIDGRTSEDEVNECYRKLGKLFAELLDENCLLIYLPDSGAGFPINEDTEAALRSENPVSALQETLAVPIIDVPDDDPLMKAAVAEARERWPKFITAFEASRGENFSIKAPITRDGNTEYIWISVTSLEGDLIYGTLGNDPVNLGSLKLGSKVSVPVAELNDWCYIDAEGDLTGGFTIKAVQEAARRRRK
ncbi:MAG: DUF2314 domain-containing protein [Planctomycetia bacterium]|nr:DUF2314 domain-containing protein [Planctomycetia bacterium]